MSLTKVSYSMITGAFVNILDFGADATGATDSRAAIQAAIDYAYSLGNGTGNTNQPPVYLPEGKYLIQDSLVLRDYARIVGAGINNTEINATFQNKSAIKTQYGESPTVSDRTEGWNLSEFTLRSTLQQTGSIGINMGGVSGSIFKNIRIASMEYCVVGTQIVQYNTWERMDLAGKFGFYFNSDGGSNTILDPKITFTYNGIRIDKGDFSLIGGSIEGLGALASPHYCLYIGKTPSDSTVAVLKCVNTYFETYDATGELGNYFTTAQQCSLLGITTRGFASTISTVNPLNLLVIGNQTNFSKRIYLQSISFSNALQGNQTAIIQSSSGNNIEFRNSNDTGYSSVSVSAFYPYGDAARLWTTGTGSPEGVVTASPGAMYLNTSGGVNTTLYVKESGNGNTGWIAK